MLWHIEARSPVGIEEGVAGAGEDVPGGDIGAGLGRADGMFQAEA